MRIEKFYGIVRYVSIIELNNGARRRWGENLSVNVNLNSNWRNLTTSHQQSRKKNCMYTLSWNKFAHGYDNGIIEGNT